MEQSPSQPISRARVRGFLVVSLLLTAFQLCLLVPAWQEWQAGTPDRYRSEHLRQLMGAVTGLAMALALPIPLVQMRLSKTPRGPRVALWGLWSALMAVGVYGIWLGR